MEACEWEHIGKMLLAYTNWPELNLISRTVTECIFLKMKEGNYSVIIALNIPGTGASKHRAKHLIHLRKNEPRSILEQDEKQVRTLYFRNLSVKMLHRIWTKYMFFYDMIKLDILQFPSHGKHMYVCMNLFINWTSIERLLVGWSPRMPLYLSNEKSQKDDIYRTIVKYTLSQMAMHVHIGGNGLFTINHFKATSKL